MAEAMTHTERFEAAVNLEIPDRVPVAPLSVYLYPKLAGISVSEYLFDPVKAIAAMDKVYEMLGGFDAAFPPLLGCAHYSLLPTCSHSTLWLDWRVPRDEEWKRFVIPNLMEKPIFENYDDVMENGFAKYIRPLGIPLRDLLDYNSIPAVALQEYDKWYEKRGVPYHVASIATVPFDLISFMRGIVKSAVDIYERPDKVKEMSEWLMDPIIATGEHYSNLMSMGKTPGAKRIFLGAGRSSMTFLSPDQFKEFVWPYMKRIIVKFVEDGYEPYLHFDGDFTPVVDLFKELPKKSKIIFGAEKTDMLALKRAIGDGICIYGNVPSNLLAYGTPEEVRKYCEKLIDDCAPGGGFILGTECETPYNATVENIRAMINTAKEYGKY